MNFEKLDFTIALPRKASGHRASMSKPAIGFRSVGTNGKLVKEPGLDVCRIIITFNNKLAPLLRDKLEFEIGDKIAVGFTEDNRGIGLELFEDEKHTAGYSYGIGTRTKDPNKFSAKLAFNVPKESIKALFGGSKVSRSLDNICFYIDTKNDRLLIDTTKQEE